MALSPDLLAQCRSSCEELFAERFAASFRSLELMFWILAFLCAAHACAAHAANTTCSPGMQLLQKGNSARKSKQFEWLPQGDCPAGSFQIPPDYRRETFWQCCSGRCPGGGCFSDCGCKCTYATNCAELGEDGDRSCRDGTGCHWTGEECVDAEANGITTTIFTLPAGHIIVDIGHSGRNEKCVQVSESVSCDSDAGNLEKRANGNPAPDTFLIFLRPEKSEVCAQRTDSPRGMGLKIVCAVAGTTTTTTTTTTLSTSMRSSHPSFTPATEPMDQACRGRNHTDNSASYYEVIDVTGVQECRQKCLDMNGLCKGIEYSGLSRCCGRGQRALVPSTECHSSVVR
ncbi:unnamed protein product [Symbiodinium natans]|uniref:Uncharacterized protein n=1 Tax=Symbiodinium natans TaxID=878477 RepID=A0A812I256_9DINO|nr:unnamed protein product [Symbiodinium natans]